MKTMFYGLAIGLLAVAAPAAASTVVNGSCVSVKSSSGCLFSGNINSNGNGNANSYLSAQNAYNLYNDTYPSANPDITLNVLAASNDANFSTFGSVTGKGSSGTWSLDGFVANYYAVKAGAYFALYQLATPASSGTWNTFDLPYNRNPRELSHLVFFGNAAVSAVPEPATWGLMILGFGLVGGAMRRRQTATTVRFA